MYVTCLTLNTIMILYFFSCKSESAQPQATKTPVHSCEMQLRRHIKQQIMEEPDSTVKNKSTYSP